MMRQARRVTRGMMFAAALGILAPSARAMGDARAVYQSWNADSSVAALQALVETPRARHDLLKQERVQPVSVQDVYKDIFASVDQTHLLALLRDMSGVNPVSVGGETFSITDRFSPAAKANYRKYWVRYFQSLGMTTQVLAFPHASFPLGGEKEGHNVEAVLRGASPDSVVIIVHYDSIGPLGPDNPAADDDMTGMATLMETARILAARQGALQRTVRFVAADYEEWGGLEGSRNYAKYIRALSQTEHFNIVAAIDDEQSGWNEGNGGMFDVYSCGGAADSTALGDMLAQTAALYSGMQTTRGCMGSSSDQYSMWEIGVPAVVFSEHDAFSNPHFDMEGGDTFDKIDQSYFFHIAQVGVTFAARVVGIFGQTLSLASR